MISMSDIVIGARAILNEGCGYIFATSGQIWTQEDQNTVNNGKKMTGPPAQTEKTKSYGGQWVGKHVYDCSGLWVALMAKWGAYIFHGSNTIWREYCRDKGEIEFGRKQGGKELKPGTAVFLYRKSDDNRHHIGVYIGGGKCIEAKGTKYGVVQSDISHWDEWGEIKGIDYGGEAVNYPVVKRGCKGAEVKTVQALLNGCGYNLDVDGSFGEKTEKAVKAFQQSMGLKPDGIVGDQTWAALIQEPQEEEPEKTVWLDIGKIELGRDAALQLFSALQKVGIGE